MEAAECIFRRYVRRFPHLAFKQLTLVINQRQALAFGILEAQDITTAKPADWLCLDLMLRQPFGPVIQ